MRLRSGWAERIYARASVGSRLKASSCSRDGTQVPERGGFKLLVWHTLFRGATDARRPRGLKRLTMVT